MSESGGAIPAHTVRDAHRDIPYRDRFQRRNLLLPVRSRLCNLRLGPVTSTDTVTKLTRVETHALNIVQPPLNALPGAPAIAPLAGVAVRRQTIMSGEAIREDLIDRARSKLRCR